MARATRVGPINSLLRNAARGGSHYADIRRKLAALLRDAGEIPEAALTPYLVERLFGIGERNWLALALTDGDWDTLGRLLSGGAARFDEFYVSLWKYYIQANAATVRRLYSDSAEISSAVLQDDGQRITDVQSRWAAEDRQSLLSLKTKCAQHNASDDGLADTIRGTLKSIWGKERFLYPLIYYFINNTSDQYIDTLLTFVVDSDGQTDIELEAIKYFLRDEASNLPATARAYFALLAHPFDACEMLCNYVEGVLSSQRPLSKTLVDAFDAVAKFVDVPRVRFLRTLIAKEKVAAGEPAPERLLEHFQIADAEASLICEVASLRVRNVSSSAALSRPLKTLRTIRNERLPTLEDYNYLVVNGQKWSFVDGGRLLDALTMALYLLPRESSSQESRRVIRTLYYFGSVVPLAVSAPSGWDLLAGSRTQVSVAAPASALAETVNQQLADGALQGSRLWINAAQWSLREAQLEMRVQRWLKLVREKVRVAPAYLSGISWSWIDDVLSIFQLRPFVARFDGIYALLLRQIEERDPDGIELRVALEPLTRGKTLDEVVELLINEFKNEAVAFVRYFFTSENILLMSLAPNLTAAVASRIAALEECIRRYGFNELMAEDQYRSELRALNTAFSLMNVAAGQFEVPWGMFKGQLTERESDTYDAYVSVRPDLDPVASTGRGRVVTPHQFANGLVIKYSFEARQWPSVHLILVIVEAFLEHPSFGLEAILSTRFRHDTLRREFVRNFDEVRGTYILGVGQENKDEIIDILSAEVADLVQEWTDVYMRSRSEDSPQAAFDLAPSQSDMSDLIEATQDAEHFDAFIDVVFQWLQARLLEQVVSAKELFLKDLQPRIYDKIEQNRAALAVTGPYRTSDVTNVATAASSSVRVLIESLTNWFQTRETSKIVPMAFSEIERAATGVFENHVLAEQLVVALRDETLANRVVSADFVRLCFDLLVEAFNNAWKHRPNGRAQIRISHAAHGGMQGILISSTAVVADVSDRTVEGEPYTSLSDELFREGNSGLRKMAALAATTAGCSLSIKASRRRQSFHVFVPLWPQESAP